MAYRIRYQASIDFIPAGRGLGMDYQVQNMPGEAGGNQQTMTFFDTGQGVSATFTATDITALLLAMSNDLSAQMNAAATLARIQGFASGGG